MDHIMLIVLGWRLQRPGEQDQLDQERSGYVDHEPERRPSPAVGLRAPAQAHSTAPAELGWGDRP
ncbi:hypothetical protein [Nonomuraea sp. NEAU-A123]|uniref:hypothetical protein n=1 Tax=Nonomuraea sp. NEAU-A123 TaxID=2839649 RepID=UPI001BE43145|nr:hypothetical protein [Nonomuraea sp. NEAU-A123]MBT2234732.1 hypothetical protein [Nonomuraea sp. NEAU-A123]